MSDDERRERYSATMYETRNLGYRWKVADPFVKDEYRWRLATPAMRVADAEKEQLIRDSAAIALAWADGQDKIKALEEELRTEKQCSTALRKEVELLRDDVNLWTSRYRVSIETYGEMRGEISRLESELAEAKEKMGEYSQMHVCPTCDKNFEASSPHSIYCTRHCANYRTR